MDAKVKSLLNSFADTQPALRLHDQPLQSSNPQLGDQIEKYSAASSAHWSGNPPKTIKEALDRIAAALGPIA